MNKNRISREALARALPNVNRPGLRAHFLLLALLLLTLGIASLQPRTSAKAKVNEGSAMSQSKASARNCPECLQAYQDCLGNGGSNCLPQYQACLANCQ